MKILDKHGLTLQQTVQMTDAELGKLDGVGRVTIARIRKKQPANVYFLLGRASRHLEDLQNTVTELAAAMARL